MEKRLIFYYYFFLKFVHQTSVGREALGVVGVSSLPQPATPQPRAKPGHGGQEEEEDGQVRKIKGGVSCLLRRSTTLKGLGLFFVLTGPPGPPMTTATTTRRRRRRRGRTRRTERSDATTEVRSRGQALPVEPGWTSSGPSSLYSTLHAALPLPTILCCSRECHV